MTRICVKGERFTISGLSTSRGRLFQGGSIEWAANTPEKPRFFETVAGVIP